MDYRRKLGLSQMEFACLLSELTGTDIAQARICRWENGYNNVLFPRLLFQALELELKLKQESPS